jgi:hypothetical protein
MIPTVKIILSLLDTLSFMLSFLYLLYTVPVIKQSELMNLKPKTFNYMRLRELLLENSTNANLVVMLVILNCYIHKYSFIQ